MAIRIYHHELHQKLIRKSAILKLETSEGIIQGHTACAKYLEDSVADLLLHKAQLDPVAQHILLQEVEPVFTEADNEMLSTLPTEKEVKETLSSSNQHAAPGTDEITAFLYSKHWDILGNSLTEVIRAVFTGKQPTPSQRTSLMVFGAKPKKSTSLKPKDKERSPF